MSFICIGDYHSSALPLSTKVELSNQVYWLFVWGQYPSHVCFRFLFMDKSRISQPLYLLESYSALQNLFGTTQ